MFQAEIRKDRVISELPPPFCQEMTPYKELEFSDTVKSVCSSYIPSLSYLRMCKVIVLGDLGVGKTSLVNRFCHQTYNYDYKATIGVDFELELFHILKVPFNLQLWDTAGQERFKSIAGAYYRSAHAVITVFDLSSSSSLRNCVLWLKEALECNDDEPLKFLVGTKRDLMMGSVYHNIEKQAGEVAELMGAEYWSVSSKTGWQVTEFFHRLAALTFERLIISDWESTEQNHPFQLGHRLKGSKNGIEMKLRKRDVRCDMGIRNCKF